MDHWKDIQRLLTEGDFRAVARAISLVENEVEGYGRFLESLRIHAVPVIGLTGPPGAGKSTLTDALVGELTDRGLRVAVLCVDPSSPFNMGALLGDRIRMSAWYNHPGVFIRSLATRGSLGGLHPRILEITDVLKAARFDYVLVETVGVGQSEVEIAGLADTTVVVLVPEGGDDVQAMKAGLMEIADIFVVNKADRPEADLFVRNLRLMLSPVFNTRHHDTPVLKTVATEKQGLAELFEALQRPVKAASAKKQWLLAEKAYRLIQEHRMKGVDKALLQSRISQEVNDPGFNVYRFVKEFV